MITLSPQDVMSVNAVFNKADTPWVNKALLDSAFSAYLYYDSDIEQICSIFRGLIKNHAFSDGNKRTATAVLVSYLEQNLYEVKDTVGLCDLALDVAIHNYDVSEIVLRVQSLIKLVK